MSNKDETLLLKHYILNNNHRYPEIERTFYNFIDDAHRKYIPIILYNITKGNKNFLNEIFDDETYDNLNNELANFEF